jgi:hypothetical protein
MTFKHWRIIRNLAFLVAVLVTSIQLWIIFPTIQNVVSELTTGNSLPAIGDADGMSPILRVALLQIIGLPAWIIAFAGWWMARCVGAMEQSD